MMLITVGSVLLASLSPPAGASTDAAGCTAGFGHTSIAEAKTWFRDVSATDRLEAWAVGVTRTDPADESQVVPAAEHWDGYGWSRAPLPSVASGGGELTSVADRGPTDAWAVGSEQPTGSTWPKMPVALHWDGQSWSRLVLPVTNGALTDVLAQGQNDVWAVGYDWDFGSLAEPFGTTTSIALHWDGSAWQALPTLTNVTLSGVAPDGAGGLWLVGYRDDPQQGIGQAVIYQWTGGSLVQVATPAESGTSSYLDGVTLAPDGQAWAVGSQTPTNDTSVALIEHWNGTSWQQVPAPAPPTGSAEFDQLKGVAARSSADVWAVGSSAAQGRFGSHTLVEHWDGASWARLSTPEPGDQPATTPYSDLTGVAAAADGTVWTVGSSGEPRTGSVAQVLCENTVDDSGFAAAASSADVAETVAWRFGDSNTGRHRIVDATGTGLFDSDARNAGGSYTFTPPGAGDYIVADAATGATSTLGVTMTATAKADDTFYLRWGTNTLDRTHCTCFYDVEIRRPGTLVFAPYQIPAAEPGANWKPAQTGVYGFRARFHQGTSMTGWSPILSVYASGSLLK